MDRLSLRRGFTLVELLVVITIIGILVAMLMPAVQMAREAGRRAQCQNNLKQIGIAFLAHESARGYLPTGGWGWQWVGDPDRGFDNRQPGGWAFNILPDLSQQPTYRLGANEDEVTKRAAFLARVKVPIEIFCCPSRRRPIAYPNIGKVKYQMCSTETEPFPKVLARTDYAANLGSEGYVNGNSPDTLESGNARTDQEWKDTYGPGSNGICFRRSMVTVGEILDGQSNTYMVGEKYVWSNHYTDGREAVYDADGKLALVDDHCVYSGHDCTVLRQAFDPPMQDRLAPEKGVLMERADGTKGYFQGHLAFGSAHGTSWNVVFCDGSVRPINYTIDLGLHRNLANRSDGALIDLGKL